LGPYVIVAVPVVCRQRSTTDERVTFWA